MKSYSKSRSKQTPYERRRRDAIRRAEKEANRFLDWLRAKGGPIDGATVAKYFDEVKRDELAKLDAREAKRSLIREAA